MTSKILNRATDYIRNAGGSVKIEHFDDDHEPAGPMTRKYLIDDGLAKEMDGFIMLREERMEKNCD